MAGDAELLTGDSGWENFYRSYPRWLIFQAGGAPGRDVAFALELRLRQPRQKQRTTGKQES